MYSMVQGSKVWRTYCTDVSSLNLATLQSVATFGCKAQFLDGFDAGLCDWMGLARQEG